VTYNVATAPVKVESTAGLVQAGGDVAVDVKEESADQAGGLAEPPAEEGGVQEPPGAAEEKKEAAEPATKEAMAESKLAPTSHPPPAANDCRCRCGSGACLRRRRVRGGAVLGVELAAARSLQDAAGSFFPWRC